MLTRMSARTAYAVALAVALLVGSPLQADSPAAPLPSIEEFQRYLDAGEFAPALQMARRQPEATERDAWLSRLAQAQAKSGSRKAAFATLVHISEDQSRNSAIRDTQDALPNGAAGGTQADFDTLIDLITSTVKPDTWDEVGGPGAVSPFTNGVYVDAAGELKRVLQPREAKGLALARLEAIDRAKNTDAHRDAPLRKISLNRLEKHVQLRLAAGQRPSEEMLHMAGLERIKYVLVYPQTQDLVIAGPAGPWRVDDEGRTVSRASGRPVVRLDDLVVVLRYLTASPQGTFGCSINPTDEGLARTRQFVDQSSAAPIKPGSRSTWLTTLRKQMGRQSISVDGIDPRTRVARVLVEADYRMKLVGMGLEEGAAGVPSYLSLIQLAPGEAPPPLDVLRWWFTLRYDAVQSTKTRDAFEIRGPGAQVMSENELLTALGQRVHTGKSDPLNADFAHRFTAHFQAMTVKYPVYADLQNIFDLALVSALIRSEGLADQVGWHMTCFLDDQQYQVPLGPAPQSVETVINHRVINGRHIVAGVSGGVRVEPWKLVSRKAIRTDEYGALRANRALAEKRELPLEAWWWD